MRRLLLLAAPVLAACASSPPPLPPDLLALVDAELAALPPGAEDRFFKEDLERTNRLRASRRGTEEDREFLEKRMVGEQIPRVWAELARAPRVGRRVPAPPLPEGLVVIHFKDGRKVTGTLVEVDDKHVKVKARLGTLTLDRSAILRVELPE